MKGRRCFGKARLALRAMFDTVGAIVTPSILTRAQAMGLDPQAVLSAHDSYGLFDAMGDLVRTGPKHTNVNDLRAVLVASL